MRSEQPPAAYAVGGAPVGALVRVVVGVGDLQVDTDGSANGARWTTIAHLDGVLPGYFLNVLLDSALPAGTYVGALPAPVPAAPSFALAAFGTSLDAGGWSSADQFPRAVADVNGDGMADLAGVSETLATGGGRFAAPSLTLSAFGTAVSAGGWTCQNAYPRLLGDFDADGMADLAAFGIAGVTVARAFFSPERGRRNAFFDLQKVIAT